MIAEAANERVNPSMGDHQSEPSMEEQDPLRGEEEEVYEEAQEPTGQGNTQQELLTITIDIGNGMQENIQVFEGDNPYELARDFAHRHSLDLRLTDLLASQIQNNIDQVLLQGGAND